MEEKEGAYKKESLRHERDQQLWDKEKEKETIINI